MLLERPGSGYQIPEINKKPEAIDQNKNII